MNNSTYKILLSVAFMLGTLACVAQPNGVTVQGAVKDKESMAPLANISVYINGTTFSTQTDKNGLFLLRNIPLQLFELTFSAVNYQTQSFRIDSQNAHLPVAVKLTKAALTLNEVVVTAKDRSSWTQFGETFKRDFLSYSSFSKKCAIVNYTVIRFRNNKRDNLIKATAKEPLIIINEALGYEITYWLEAYEHRFGQQLLLFNGYSQFAELKGNKSRQKEWARNRNSAYNGSLVHFLQSLYNGTTSSEGFVVNPIKTISYKDLGVYVPAFADTISTNNADTFSNYINQIAADTGGRNRDAANWLEDADNQTPFRLTLTTPDNKTESYFFIKDKTSSKSIFVYKYVVQYALKEQKIDWRNAGKIIPQQEEVKKIEGLEQLSPEQKGKMPVKLFYTQAVNVSDFMTRKNGNVFLKFADSWQVTYTKEAMDKEYIRENSIPRENSVNQFSILSMADGQPVQILANGYYVGTYSLVTGAYWAYEKNDKLLPLDFVPK